MTRRLGAPALCAAACCAILGYTAMVHATGTGTGIVAVRRHSGRIDTIGVEYEAGALYVFQNDGRYGEHGTQFTAGDVGQQRNLFISRRWSLEVGFHGRHRLILLYAPFDLETVVRLKDDLRFRDTTFDAGTRVVHRYLFDGYRASYLYRLLSRPELDGDLGGSIQIRNAEVSFAETSGNRYETENDIGVVFALKGRLLYRRNAGATWVLLEGDGFSTFGLLGDEVRGAIYDVRVSAGIPVTPYAELFAGARLLGGGAEVERRNIENWGNYGSLTLGVRFHVARTAGVE